MLIFHIKRMYLNKGSIPVVLKSGLVSVDLRFRLLNQLILVLARRSTPEQGESYSWHLVKTADGVCTGPGYER